MAERTYHNRSTSAGYRLPITSRPRSSDFHQSCVPETSKKAAAAHTSHPGGEVSLPKYDPVKDDVVTQDTIWKQAVATEKRGVRQWERDWGFLAEYDPKGRPKTPKELPETSSIYSDHIPNTNSGNYGNRLNTDVGVTMQKLEFKFNSHNRKKKLGDNLICY